MKFKEKNKEKKEKTSHEDNDIEIVLGDDSNLAISDVGDCVNELRPKDCEKKKKEIVIPKTRK